MAHLRVHCAEAVEPVGPWHEYGRFRHHCLWSPATNDLTHRGDWPLTGATLRWRHALRVGDPWEELNCRSADADHLAPVEPPRPQQAACCPRGPRGTVDGSVTEAFGRRVRVLVGFLARCRTSCGTSLAELK